jgi:serine protease inhibitor
VDGLAAVEASLKARDLEKTLQDLESSKGSKCVDLEMPRFKFASSITSNQALDRTGAGRAFTSLADFSGMLATSHHISELTQDVGVEVDEKGTEVVAVVNTKMLATSLPEGYFHADHPFLFRELSVSPSGEEQFRGGILPPEQEVFRNARQ